MPTRDSLNPDTTWGETTLQKTIHGQPTGPISYWRSRTSEEQPPDITGTVEEIQAWIDRNPPLPEGGILEMEGTKMLAVQKHRSAGPSVTSAQLEALAADLERHLNGPADPLLVEVWNSNPLDTSKPDSIPEPSWRAKQRQTSMRERPVVKQETWTSRKQRRATGDRRTAKQIVTSMKEG